MQNLLKTTLLLLSLLVLETHILNAQQRQAVVRLGAAVQVSPEVQQPQLVQPVTESSTSTGPVLPLSLSLLRSNDGPEIAGETYYDQQTNYSEQARVHVWPDGNVSMGWTGAATSPESAGWADRGSYVNSRDLWLNGTLPNLSNEPLRTGGVNYVVTENGTELTFAHRVTGTGKYRIRMSRRVTGSSVWEQLDVPSQLPSGALWCKAATDGNSVHLIALSTPTSSGGQAVLGVDGHLLYYRSLNDGQTWDLVDQVIPGLDSSFYRAIRADQYAMTARGGVVAVATFDSWNSVVLFKSLDNGATWIERKVVLDFPLVGYLPDQGYTVNDLGGIDPDAPDSLAILTSDGAGSLAIDDLGQVHVFAGKMYVIDEVFDDGVTSYYPNTNGLLYWSEANPVLTEIAGALDLNGDNLLNVSLSNGYSTSLSSMPSAATDAEGSVYVLFSAIRESLVPGPPGALYRHIYATKSPDGGFTWGAPIDVQHLINQAPDSSAANQTEAVYPSVYKRIVDGKLHAQFQSDGLPGTTVGAGTPNVISQIVYAGLESDQLFWLPIGPPSITKAPINSMEFSLVPNPASGNTTVTVNLAGKEQTSLQVVDVTGAVVRNLQYSNLAAGQNFLNLNTSDLANGVYFVRVQSGNRFGTKKLVVMH